MHTCSDPVSAQLPVPAAYPQRGLCWLRCQSGPGGIEGPTTLPGIQPKTWKTIPCRYQWLQSEGLCLVKPQISFCVDATRNLDCSVQCCDAVWACIVCSYKGFGWTFRLHFKGSRRCVPPKRRQPPTRLRNVTTLKITIDWFTAVRTSDLRAQSICVWPTWTLQALSTGGT